MPPATRFFKFLNEDGRTPQRDFQWPLPSAGNDSGAWTDPLWGRLAHCERGYHVVTVPQFWDWLAPALWEVQVAGEILRREDKCVVFRARLYRRIEAWNERTQRIFAADCAEHVLHISLKSKPNDDRPAKAIRAVRDFANGLITRKALAAAESAAWAAAWTAAESATESAAWAAARAAAESAAWAAPWAAARAAAESAAWAAAWAAAWTAAWTAAESATESATESAERKWQEEHLREMLGLYE